MVTLGASMVLRKRTVNEPSLPRFLSVLHDHRAGACRTPDRDSIPAYPSPRLVLSRGEPASWRLRSGGCCSVIAVDANGNIGHCRLTLTGATPIRARSVEESLIGAKPSDALFKDAARRATETLEPDSDIHASAEYRRSACAALARRALAQAAQRQRNGERNGAMSNRESA